MTSRRPRLRARLGPRSGRRRAASRPRPEPWLTKYRGRPPCAAQRTASSARVKCTCRSGRGSTATRTPFDRAKRPMPR
eukprot:2578218-Alexandrium_andersonii.AAC.1